MKRIFKLKGELVVIALLSFIVSFLGSAILKGMGIGHYNADPAYRVNIIYSQLLTDLKNELKSLDFNNHSELQQLLNDKYSFSQGYGLYIVDETGKIAAQSNKGAQIIDGSEVRDGKREYSVSEKNKSIFKIAGCDYLKDGYFLYYTYLGYGHDDRLVLVLTLIGFIILFFLLIWGRVSYISKIKSSVQLIAEGDLSHRVPVKYKNELRELAEDINHMASELEKEDRLRSEFLTNISHDLRTPLTTILGYMDMIQKGKYDSKEELEKYISVIERKGIFLKNMLDDFFQYSKLSSRDVTLNLQTIELNELVRQLQEDEKGVFKEKSLELAVHFSKGPVWIEADPELLVRAVNNLLNNALKYSRANSSVQISVSSEKRNNTAYGYISISNFPRDEISEEEVENFFKRLYKKDKSRHEEGSGLGLSIVKDIVKLHGGYVKGYKEEEKLVFKMGGLICS